MALKALMLRKQLDGLNARMETLRAKTTEFEAREAELETALNEAATDEELSTVNEAVETFDSERREHEAAVATLQAEIDAKTEELQAVEAAQPQPAAPAPTPTEKTEERKDDVYMTRENRAFGKMTREQRAAFIAREDIKEFLTRFRAMFSERRAVSGADLLIPTVVLDLIRENIEDYSKLINRVRLVQVRGRARQVVMGAIPEAVWTEMCAALNELSFTMSQVEVDGYKVGGYVAICNATLSDTDGVLLSEVIIGLGAAIGKSLDKAILFGTGVKMPLGIAARLSQTSSPTDYPDTARPWANLSQSNVITIPSGSTTGLALFQALARAAGAAKGKYSRGAKFWAMNEATYTTLQVEAMSINTAGAIVSAQEGTMPVVGGDIVVLSDEIMPNATIIGGYGDLYLLAEREGTSVAQSEHALFIQDQTVVKATARYDGLPVIAEAFVAIGIGKAPTLAMPFAPDVANPAVAALASLTIGSLTLTPTFSPTVEAYTTTTTNASNAISAVPTVGALAVIKVNGKKIQNGSSATWETGENVVSIVVTNGDESTTYAVTVTKS